MKVNMKIVILSIFLALLMYPKTIEFFVDNGKNIYTARKLSHINMDSNSDSIDRDKVQITFVFDNGWESVYTEAYDIMKRYDFKASVSIIPSRVDDIEYMSYGQLSDLYLQGWDLLNNSYSHKENRYDSTDNLLKDFHKAIQWMKNRYIGKNADMLVMPFGEINPYLIGQLVDAGYRNVRTSDNIIELDKTTIQYYPVHTINLLADMTVNEVEELLTKKSEEMNTIMIILYKIGDHDDGFGMTYSKEKLEQIIKYIDEHKDEFQVVTYSQLFK